MLFIEFQPKCYFGNYICHIMDYIICVYLFARNIADISININFDEFFFKTLMYIITKIKAWENCIQHNSG